MATTDEDIDLITIAEAAQLLKVSTVTVHRWLKQGILPAYRMGPRQVHIRRSDLHKVLTPVSKQQTSNGVESSPEDIAEALRPLTEDETNEGLAAIREARALREQMLAERHGKLFSPSWPMIRKAREERSKHPGPVSGAGGSKGSSFPLSAFHEPHILAGLTPSRANRCRQACKQ